MNYTPQQFNEMAAKAENVPLIGYGDEAECMHVFTDGYKGLMVSGDSNYYNPHKDLNQLMPLVWKYVSFYAARNPHNLDYEFVINGFDNKNKDPIQAIRDCLWKIWSEDET